MSPPPSPSPAPDSPSLLRLARAHGAHAVASGRTALGVWRGHAWELALMTTIATGMAWLAL